MKRVIQLILSVVIFISGIALVSAPAEANHVWVPSACLSHIWVADKHNGSFEWRNLNMPGQPYFDTWGGYIQDEYFALGKTCGKHKGVTSNVYAIYGYYKVKGISNWFYDHIGNRQNFECGWITRYHSVISWEKIYDSSSQEYVAPGSVLSRGGC